MLLSLPGVAVDRDAQIADGAMLRFGYGKNPRITTAVRFRATLAAGDGPPTTIFEASVPADDQAWHDAAVDLSAWAGQSARLSLHTETAERVDPRHGFAYWAHPELVAPTIGSPPTNVLLISIDTLRSDRMSLYGHSRPTSPRIDAWARARGAVFDTAVATSPWTLPSHISMLTGLDAVGHGVNHGRPMPQALYSLAERFRAAGYQTVAFTGGGYVHPEYGLAQGFDRFRAFTFTVGDDGELASGTAKASRWLETHADQPFFMLFHTYEVHLPYRPRQPWFGRFSEHDPALEVVYKTDRHRSEDGFLSHRRGSVRRADEALSTDIIPDAYASLPGDLYDAGIAYMDEHVGRLLARLDGLGLSQRTIVVLTSDHGEMLGEHGTYGHLYLYDENLLVPLVIADPARRGAGQRLKPQVRTVDIAPTILELAGQPAFPGVDGVSLVPLLEGGRLPPMTAWSYAAASNHGLSVRRQGRFKYQFKNGVWPMPTVPRETLYALDSPR